MYAEEATTDDDDDDEDSDDDISDDDNDYDLDYDVDEDVTRHENKQLHHPADKHKGKFSPQVCETSRFNAVCLFVMRSFTSLVYCG